MIEAPTPAEYSRIARRRIFFGHRSVGSNLMKGVSEMYVGRAGPVYQILETTEPEHIAGAGMFHAQIGDDGDPAGQTRTFGEILDAGFGDNGDIALHVYCYEDVTPTTNVKKLFDDYRTSIDSLRARHPRILVAHMTMPLTTMETPFKAVMSTLLRRPVERRDANAKRNDYNRLLLDAYGPEGTVFDLARLQSTRLDGTRVSQRSGERTIHGLAEELTMDGAHLNALARPIFAAAFLRFLAVLPVASSP